ncbi:MAG: SUMF1/EgtB/PvdO family nonheme iron enzyme [Thermoguttaceae bacterium]|nr:SUMF1/EgtB/PvdO family nonheme iron enzyme [Thermoguttaceae bacterium]
MHGNVWEWRQDGFGAYPSESVTDPTGPLNGSNYTFRSGSWDTFGARCHSAFRFYYAPRVWSQDLGFRCVIVQ